MINEVEPQKSESGQILKGIIEEEMKKEGITEESVKTSSSGRKKLLVFAIIGLLTLVIVYYVYECIQSLK